METAKISSAVLASNAYKQQVSSAPKAGRQASQTTQAPSEVRPVSDSVLVRSSPSLKNLDTVRAIETMHASLNQLAKGVRETNESVNSAVEKVDAMRNSIESVIKNYPPFPIDSKERNDRLMEYTSLRKELLSMMVPAPPPPPYEKVKSMWSSLFDVEGRIKDASIPSLEKTSSDAQLKEASQQLDTTTSQLSEFSNKVTQALVQP
ncbi:MAG: hypothetical protein WCP10_01835 [Desulfuromonadales bacterium]